MADNNTSKNNQCDITKIKSEFKHIYISNQENSKFQIFLLTKREKDENNDKLIIKLKEENYLFHYYKYCISLSQFNKKLEDVTKEKYKSITDVCNFVNDSFKDDKVIINKIKSDFSLQIKINVNNNQENNSQLSFINFYIRPLKPKTKHLIGLFDNLHNLIKQEVNKINDNINNICNIKNNKDDIDMKQNLKKENSETINDENINLENIINENDKVIHRNDNSKKINTNININKFNKTFYKTTTNLNMSYDRIMINNNKIYHKPKVDKQLKNSNQENKVQKENDKEPDSKTIDEETIEVNKVETTTAKEDSKRPRSCRHHRKPFRISKINDELNNSNKLNSNNILPDLRDSKSKEKYDTIGNRLFRNNNHLLKGAFQSIESFKTKKEETVIELKFKNNILDNYKHLKDGKKESLRKNNNLSLDKNMDGFRFAFKNTNQLLFNKGDKGEKGDKLDLIKKENKKPVNFVDVCGINSGCMSIKNNNSDAKKFLNLFDYKDTKK